MADTMARPTPPEPRFAIEGCSLWPFDRRRTTGPWSERKGADVYGAAPRWVRWLLGIGKPVAMIGLPSIQGPPMTGMRDMTAEDLAAITPGTIIRHKHSAKCLIVTANYGDHAIAVRTQYVSNPSEWLIADATPSSDAPFEQVGKGQCPG